MWTKEQRREWDRKYAAKNRDRINAYARAQHVKHREARNAKSREWYAANREGQTIKAREDRWLLRESVLTAYGYECACCGETEPHFLTIDHIHGGGKKHLKEIGCTENLYRWLRDHGFPKDDFRLLCYNCNMGRAKYGGICPHIPEPAEEAA